MRAEYEALKAILKAYVKSSNDAKFFHRLHCVILATQGKSANEIAKIFGDNPSSITRWTRHVNEFGIQGLYDDDRPGRPTKLSFEQQQQLKKEVNLHPAIFGYKSNCWDGKLLAEHLKKKYDIDLSIRQCQRMLKAMNKEKDTTQN